MDVTDSTWRASTLIYRALVLGQTIAWALGTVFIRFVSRPPHGLLATVSVGQVLTILSIVGLVVGLATYARGPKTSVGTRRGTVILAWTCFQVAGLCAWFGYILSGEAICFAAGVMTLILMHGFGPGRLRNTGQRAA